MAEIPEKIEIGIIKLEEGKIHTHVAWGIAYKLTEHSEEKVANTVFNSKSGAEKYISEYFKLAAEAKPIPVRRKVWTDEHGNITSTVEPLS